MGRQLAMCAISMVAILTACDSSDEISPEVLERTDRVEQSVQFVAADLGHYTALSFLAIEDMVTQQAETALYTEHTGEDIAGVFIALAAVYVCVPRGADTVALDAMSQDAVAMHQELSYHRIQMASMSTLDGSRLEVRRHQAAMEPLVLGMLDATPQLEAEAVDYACPR